MRRARRALRRFARRVGRFGRILKRVSIAVTAFGVAAAFAFQRVARAGEMFNRKMNRSLAIMSGVSDSVRKTMERTALKVASTTTHSAEQAAESYFFLASAGLNVKQSIAALSTVASFAQAGMFDMARATDLLTDAQSALGMTVKNTARNMANMRKVADVLVKANTLANASVEQFSESLTRKAGAALKVLNKDIEEGVAVLAAFADQGIKGSDAGTALNIVLRDLSTKAIKNAKAFAAHGISVFDLTGKMRNLAFIVSDVEQSLEGMSDKQAKATLLQLGFSDKSVIFLQTLLGLSRRINAYEFALRRAGGAMERVAAKQLTPFEKSLAKLKSAWVALSNVMKPAVEIVASLMDVMATNVQNFANTLKPNVIVDWVEDSLNAMERLAKGVDRVFGRLRANWQIFKMGLRLSIPGQLATAGAAMLGGSPDMAGAPAASGLGTRVRRAMGAAQRVRELELAKERLRNIEESFLGFFNTLKFEAQRNAGHMARVFMDLILGRFPLPPAFGERTRPFPGEPGRIPAELRQISPSRFFLQGLTGVQAKEQRVRDPQIPEVIRVLREIERKNNVAVTS